MICRVFFHTPALSTVTALYTEYPDHKLRSTEIDAASCEQIARDGFWLLNDTVQGIDTPPGYVPPGAIVRIEQLE